MAYYWVISTEFNMYTIHISVANMTTERNAQSQKKEVKTNNFSI